MESSDWSEGFGRRFICHTWPAVCCGKHTRRREEGIFGGRLQLECFDWSDTSGCQWRVFKITACVAMFDKT